MSTESTNLQQGDERAYEAMARAAQKSVSELLVPFKTAADAEALLKTMSIEEFFRGFLVHADRFTDQCCEQYAGIMRQCALMPEVRGTPTLVLAKEIRAQVFEPLDRILASYAQALEQLGIDHSNVSAELRDSSMIDAAMKGAAVGQVAGGFGSSGKTLGALNALIQAGTEAEKKLALLQRKAEVLNQAKYMTYRKIAEYLEAVIGLPERLLDYGCARCFGGQVSLERQRQALEDVQAAIAQELEPAVRLTLALPDAEKNIEQEQQNRATALAVEKQRQDVGALKKGGKELLKGLGIFLYVVGFIVLSAALTDEHRGSALICGSLIVILAWMLRRKKPEIPAVSNTAKSVSTTSLAMLGLMIMFLVIGAFIQLGAFVPKEIRLMEAAKNRDINAATSLIGRGVNVNYWDKTTEGTALSWAAVKDDLPMVTLLLQHGADPNLAFPLVLAATMGDEEMVRALLANGADLNQQMPDGTRAILAALMTNPNSPGYDQKVSIAKLLLQKGANPNAAHPGTKFTALSHAVLLQNADLVSLLLQKGATNWNDQNMNGDSALDLAQRALTELPGNRSRQIVELLRNAENTEKKTVQERINFQEQCAEAGEALQAKKLSKARVAIQSAVLIRPDDSKAITLQKEINEQCQSAYVTGLSRVRTLVAQKNWDEASGAAREATELVAENGEATKLLETINNESQAAALLSEVKKTIAAEDWFGADEQLSKILTVKPGDEDAMKIRTDIAPSVAKARFDKSVGQLREKLSQGQYDDAAKAAGQALAIKPDDRVVQQLLEQVKAENEKEQKFQQLLTTSSGLVEQRMWADATKAADEASAMKPGDPRVVNLKEQIGKAEAEIRKAEAAWKKQETANWKQRFYQTPIFAVSVISDASKSVAENVRDKGVGKAVRFYGLRPQKLDDKKGKVQFASGSINLGGRMSDYTISASVAKDVDWIAWLKQNRAKWDYERAGTKEGLWLVGTIENVTASKKLGIIGVTIGGNNDDVRIEVGDARFYLDSEVK